MCYRVEVWCRVGISRIFKLVLWVIGMLFRFYVSGVGFVFSDFGG